MKRYLISVALLAIGTPLFAQKNIKATEAAITYGFRNNGKDVGGEKKLFIKGSQVRIASQSRQAKQQEFLDLAAAASYQVSLLNNKTYTLKKAFSEYAVPELIAGTDTILGITCKKAKVVIRSNTIEIW